MFIGFLSKARPAKKTRIFVNLIVYSKRYFLVYVSYGLVTNPIRYSVRQSFQYMPKWNGIFVVAVVRCCKLCRMRITHCFVSFAAHHHAYYCACLFRFFAFCIDLEIMSPKISIFIDKIRTHRSTKERKSKRETDKTAKWRWHSSEQSYYLFISNSYANGLLPECACIITFCAYVLPA